MGEIVVLSCEKLYLAAADIVCSKIEVTGYKSNGKPLIEDIRNKMFDGFAIVLDPVDKETSDPTCKIMLSTGKILHLKEERLVIVNRG